MTTTGKKARALLVVPALLGCDIVQGFQDAGDALFPEQSTHLSTPALRLVEGGYNSIALAAGRELSVLARSADDTGSLFVMRFANPEPCEIRDVGRFVASRNPNRAEAGIAYFHEDATQGTLHFADTACKTFDFEIDDARLPVGETEHMLAAIWRSLLRVERVGRDDSFFELGGNSLTAMQLVARIHAASSVEMPVRALFEEPTLRGMSCRLEEIRIASLVAQRDAEEAAMREMLARVAAMPDSEVQALLRELTTEGRP